MLIDVRYTTNDSIYLSFSGCKCGDGVPGYFLFRSTNRCELVDLATPPQSACQPRTRYIYISKDLIGYLDERDIRPNSIYFYRLANTKLSEWIGPATIAITKPAPPAT